MKSKKAFEDVVFKSQIVRPIEETEVFLSFQSKVAAEAFEEWWNTKGAFDFYKYYENNLSSKKKQYEFRRLVN